MPIAFFISVIFGSLYCMLGIQASKAIAAHYGILSSQVAPVFCILYIFLFAGLMIWFDSKHYREFAKKYFYE